MANRLDEIEVERRAETTVYLALGYARGDLVHRAIAATEAGGKASCQADAVRRGVPAPLHWQSLDRLDTPTAVTTEMVYRVEAHVVAH